MHITPAGRAKAAAEKARREEAQIASLRAHAGEIALTGRSRILFRVGNLATRSAIAGGASNAERVTEHTTVTAQQARQETASASRFAQDVRDSIFASLTPQQLEATFTISQAVSTPGDAGPGRQRYGGWLLFGDAVRHAGGNARARRVDTNRRPVNNGQYFYYDEYDGAFLDASGEIHVFTGLRRPFMPGALRRYDPVDLDRETHQGFITYDDYLQSLPTDRHRLLAARSVQEALADVLISAGQPAVDHYLRTYQS